MMVGITNVDDSSTKGFLKVGSRWRGASKFLGQVMFSSNSNVNLAERTTANKFSFDEFTYIKDISFDEINKRVSIRYDSNLNVYNYTMSSAGKFTKQSLYKKLSIDASGGVQGSAISNNSVYILKNDKILIYNLSNNTLERTISINKDDLNAALKNIGLNSGIKTFEPEGIKIINNQIYFGAAIRYQVPDTTSSCIYTCNEWTGYTFLFKVL